MLLSQRHLGRGVVLRSDPLYVRGSAALDSTPEQVKKKRTSKKRGTEKKKLNRACAWVFCRIYNYNYYI